MPARPWSTTSDQTGESKIAFVSIALLTSLAPCSNTRPAPSALWPTSLLPMSSLDGRPTAGPWAASSVYNSPEVSRSRVGVSASVTAFDAPAGATPTPSAITTNTGPGRPEKDGCGFNDSESIKPAYERRDIDPECWASSSYRVVLPNGGDVVGFKLEDARSEEESITRNSRLWHIRMKRRRCAVTCIDQHGRACGQGQPP